MADPDDWRRMGQERYLHGARLVEDQWHSERVEWDHDHCEFCGAKFSRRDGDLARGFRTLDATRWICATCFADFKDEFAFTLERGE